MRKRSGTLAATLLSAAALLPLSAVADEGQVGIVSWGGSYQEAQRKAFFEPFEEATGITVVEGTGPQIERSRAEVESGKPGYDIVTSNQAFYNIGVQQGLWEPIDYSAFDAETLAQLPEAVKLEYGVGQIYYSEGMAINLEAFPADKPQPGSWADFWDVAAFPGKRTLPFCDVATFPLPEAALLADGVAPDALYPIDVPRAVKKLQDLSADVIWWKDINQPGQFLASGEAVMAMAASGRIQQLINKDAPIQIVWAGARHTFDPWYVLKGAANPENAMKFIAFASKPENQAEMARLSGNAPTNPEAFAHMDEALAKSLPTYPANFEQGFSKDEVWWLENRQAWVEACTAGLMAAQ